MVVDWFNILHNATYITINITIRLVRLSCNNSEDFKVKNSLTSTVCRKISEETYVVLQPCSEKLLYVYVTDLCIHV